MNHIVFARCAAAFIFRAYGSDDVCNRLQLDRLCLQVLGNEPRSITPTPYSHSKHTAGQGVLEAIVADNLGEPVTALASDKSVTGHKDDRHFRSSKMEAQSCDFTRM